MHGHRTRPQAALLSSAKEQWFQGRPLAIASAHNQRSCAFRPVDLMRARRNHVDAVMLKGRDLLTKCLRGVDVKVRRMIADRVSNGGYRLKHARLVIRMHDADKERGGLQCLSYGLRLDPASRFRIEIRHIKAPPLELRD